MSKLLDDLDPRFKPKAIELIARCAERDIPVMIIETRRTLAEHLDNLARGVSWTKHSKHIDGLAIDICPYSQYDLHGINKLQWNGDDPIWVEIGSVGKLLGLEWGGDWLQKDYGHFEYKED